MENKTNPVWHDLMAAAYAAGDAAGKACTPEPMHVVSSDIFGKPLPGAVVETVNDGPCGFAWVRTAGNTAFGRWAKKAGYARRNAYSGLNISVRQNTQSMARNEAAARAMVKVLQDAGIDCWMESRID